MRTVGYIVRDQQVWLDVQQQQVKDSEDEIEGREEEEEKEAGLW